MEQLTVADPVPIGTSGVVVRMVFGEPPLAYTQTNRPDLEGYRRHLEAVALRTVFVDLTGALPDSILVRRGDEFGPIRGVVERRGNLFVIRVDSNQPMTVRPSDLPAEVPTPAEGVRCHVFVNMQNLVEKDVGPVKS